MEKDPVLKVILMDIESYMPAWDTWSDAYNFSITETKQRNEQCVIIIGINYYKEEDATPSYLRNPPE